MTFAERMAALGKAGLKYSDTMRPDTTVAVKLDGLEREARLQKLIELLSKTREMKSGNVLTFIMYDI